MVEVIETNGSDLGPEEAELFHAAFRRAQSSSFGCSGDIECTFPLDGNCACFNDTLARHRIAAEQSQVERYREALDAVHYYIDASDEEIVDAKTSRADALYHARTLRMALGDQS